MKAHKIWTTTTPNYKSQLEEQKQPQEISDGWVLVENHYSSLNYKDALALTGKGKILRKPALVPGIDGAGIILKSKSSHWNEGQKVISTGCGLGESYSGGFARWTLVHEDWLVACPSNLTLKQSMILGTAGFTAGLALIRMEQNGQTPEKGTLLVNGASGGVGSFATLLFARKGYDVLAISHKESYQKTLLKLGAKKVQTWEELALGQRPLERALFAGGVDNLGGDYLKQLLSHTQLWGNVASIGLAASPEINSTVMPFILRGISLLGISSTNCPHQLRQNVWKTINHLLKDFSWEDLPTTIIELSDLVQTAERVLQRKTFGRTLVKIMN